MKRSHQLIAPAAALALFTTAIGSTNAAPVTVANFSFEAPDITNANVNGVPTGWTAPNGTGGVKYRDNYAGLVSAGIPDGNQWALVTYTVANKIVTLVQNTGVTIVEGVTYSLTVAVGEQDNQAAVDDIARIFLYGSTTGDAAPFALLDNIDPIEAGGTSAWIDYQVSFTATASQAGQSLMIGLGAGSNIANGAPSFNANVNFDKVRLNAESAPANISITSFSYDPSTGASEASIAGTPTTAYLLVEADDLDFGNPDQNPVPLTGATVGTLSGNQVTTDGNGNATVQFNLGTAKPATFIRAQTAP